MSKIILDVRSGERNDSSTGLCLRAVNEEVVEVEGRFERVGRDLYEIGSNGVDSYVLIASGDGEIGLERVDLTFSDLGGGLWLTNSRVWLSEVRDNNGNILDHYYGGTVVRSEDDLTEGYGVVGGLFWWSRNDDSRVRFTYEDRGWKLLRGGEGKVVGVVGGDDDLVLSSLSGELRLGGGNVGDLSVDVYVVGGLDFPLVLEGEEEEVLSSGVEGVVLNPSGKILFKDGSDYIGKELLHISDDLGVDDNVVSVNGYLSPQPMLNEHPLLRVAGYGYSRVEYVETEDDLVDATYGVVKVSLDSGRILSLSEVIYDGLVLCDSPVGVSTLEEVTLMDVPDGSGLEPSGVATSFRPTGVGLKWDYRWERMYVSTLEGHILPVELVDNLPKRLSVHKGYLVKGTTDIVLNRALSKSKLFSGHVSLDRGGLRHLSVLSVLGKSGSFRVNGELVTFNGLDVVGNGVSISRGHLLVDAGSVIDHPNTIEEFESLKSIGLVPDVSLESGLEFVLTRSSVKGYYSYDDEKVVDISSSTTFQFLQFEPRLDFVGYGVGQFFKVGDKVLGERDLESSFGNVPNGFHWISQRVVSNKLNQESSRLALGAGLRVGTTSISMSQEQVDGSVLTQDLVEGVDYDLPSEGLEGQARLIKRLGAEILSGQKVGALNGFDLDLEVSLDQVKQGDLFFDGLNYFKIENVVGSVITLSSTLGLQSGRWKIFLGYREGLESSETPDPTKIVGEVLDDLPVLERKPVEVYKVYDHLAFDKVLPSSSLFIRKDDVSYPLVVLRDDVLLSPYELSGVHYESNSYRIKVNGIEYEDGILQAGLGFNVVNDRVVFEKDGEVDNSWVLSEVIYVRKPRSGLVDLAEMDLSLTLTSPFTPTDSFDDFLELLANPRIEYTSGAISFEDPLESGVGVEVSYTPSDDPNGVRVIEAMGFAALQEEATRVDDYVFTYNPTNKEVELLATPTVLVGPEQISSSLYSIDQNTIRFTYRISESYSVKVSYTTLTSNGGDATVRTSSGMIVPKYKIDKGSTTLNVKRDFTSQLGAGDLLYVGTQIFNVSSVDVDSIQVSPPARVNIESDVIAFLNVPVFTYGETTSSYAFRSINGANVTAKPKSPDVFIQGDYRDFIRAKSIVVLQGTPYRVKVVGLDDVTGMTKVTVEGFTTGHDFISNGDFYVSFRPVLIEGDTNLTLSTGLLDTESYQLIKYDHTIGRGRLLTENQDYRLNSEAGLVDLVSGHVVSPQVSYYLLHTALSGVKPFTLLGGRVSKPSYRATFNQSTTPDAYDGLSLNANCVVTSPDTFQLRVADEEIYSSEIANELQQNLNQSTGSGGKFVISSSTSQGKAIGIYDLLANDVVARSRIKLYNGYIQPVDDLVSTTTGKVIGDADGSFKFDLLSGGDWIAPGLEDSITREIYPRYVSMDYLTPLNASNPYPTPQDPILIGDTPPSAKTLSRLLELQKPLIENEIDDYILIGQKEKTTFDLNAGFPYIRMDYDPVYKPMWQRHRFSRLYPTSTRMYSYRIPGALDSSTNGITIANVQNDALGQIENITSLPLVKRRSARFRVYDFNPIGYANVPNTVGKPTFIVSAVPLDEFPIDVATGLPDTTQFVVNGGDVADATLGNVERTFNGLQVGSKLSLSRNGGEFYNLLNTAEEATLIDLGLFPPVEQTAKRNVVVEQIIDGCYVVLSGLASNLTINDESLIDNPPKRNDTLIESFARDLDDDTSPTTTFRIGSDIGLKASTGELVDISLPSANDPDWPIKEIVGQNVPSSGLALEGDVDFLYVESAPFRFPALDGESFDDTGDESIPYMSRFSERDLLPQIPPALKDLQVQTLNQYVYPDEARSVAFIAQGILTTRDDFSALNGVCEQSPRQGDLVILKPDSSGAVGCAATGILELAVIENDEIYPPSFTTPATIEYEAKNIYVELANNPLNGFSVSEQWIENPNTNIYDRTETTFAFNGLPNGAVKAIFETAIAGTSIVLQHHTFVAPHANFYTFTFNFDGANWEVVLTNNLTSVSTTTQIGLVVSQDDAVNTITIIQDPVPNPYDPNGGDVWVNYADMESWLFNQTTEFWVNNNYINNEPSLTSSENGVEAFFDCRLSVFGNASIDTNRVDINFGSDFGNVWITGSWVSNIDAVIANPYDTIQTFRVTTSNLLVKEEGNAANTQTINSDINNQSFEPYYEIVAVNSTTIRHKALYGVVRPPVIGDPMSIFIGSEVDESDTILQGIASNGLINSAGDSDISPDVLRNIVANQGSIEQVLVGDLLYVENGHNSGTHRVKEVIVDAIDEDFTEGLGTSLVLPVTFPRVVSLVDNGDGTGTITTDVDDLSLYFTDSMFILLNDNYLGQPQSNQNNVFDETWGHSIVHIELDSINGSSATFTEDTRNNHENPHFLDGLHGNLPENVTIVDLITLLGNGGQVVAGITKIPFDITQTDYIDRKAMIRFEGIDISFTIAGGGLTHTVEITEDHLERADSGEIIAINLTTLDGGFPDMVDTPQGNVYHEAFLTPNDQISFTLVLEAGIYLDTTFPRLLRDYNGTTPVEFADGSSQVRSASDSTLTNLPAWNFYEEVSFTVRRLRRFTDVFSKLIYAFEGFRYLYEQRVGLVDSVVYANGVVNLTPLKVNGLNVADLNGTDTQVGDFVNVVSVGDQVKCVNNSKQETLYLRVLEVGSTLKCSAIRGSITDVLNGDVFKVITRVPLIPEMQAFDQFVEHGFTEIYSTDPIEGITVGEVNVLQDTNADFIALGVEQGDFLVIEPQGLLVGTVNEYGAPPQGDNGDGTPGVPNVLDDNRGAYKILSVDDVNTLTVEFYAGESGTTRDSYKLLPSVGGDDLQPLRQTAGIVNGTYTTTPESIHPFSYRILRRDITLDESLAGSILFFRERTQSWVEIIRSFNQLPTQPYTWSQYESNDLIDKVGETDTSHPSNEILLQSILGNEATQPFENNEICLSVYDRRMLIEDPKMASEGYGVPEEGIPTVLENDISSMNARDNRYAWISIRTDQVNGTLPKLSRVDLENPDDTALEDIK